MWSLVKVSPASSSLFCRMKVVRTLSNNSAIQAQSALVYVLSVGLHYLERQKTLFILRLLKDYLTPDVLGIYYSYIHSHVT